MESSKELKIGIIGGSGFEDPRFLSRYSSKEIKTPYGKPSSNLICGQISNVPVIVLSRHGLSHTISPSNVNYRANIWALKNEKCTHILAVTACGSLRKKIVPGHFIFPDQFVDFTKNRKNTFFDKSEVKHTPMSEPFDSHLRRNLSNSCDELNFDFHNGGTIITIEGPRFSTKAESILFKKWGCDIINMSTVPEIILANEVGIPYQSIAMSTDYDCWHENEEDVTMEMIYSVMEKNVINVKKLIEKVIHLIKNENDKI